MKKYLKTVAILSIVGVTLFGCKKDDNPDYSQQSVNDNKVAEEGFNDMAPAINERGIKDPGVKSCGSCGMTGRINGIQQFKLDSSYRIPSDVRGDSIMVNRKIELDSSTQPYKIAKIIFTITYKNIVDGGVPKNGSIQAIMVPGAGYTAVMGGLPAVMNQLPTVEGFEKKGIKYYANISATNDATNSNKINVKISKGVCTWANGDKVIYASDRTTIIDKLSEQVTLWGTVNGTNRKGNQYSIVTDAGTPLVKAKDCSYVTSGIQKLTEDSKQENVLDFGYTKGAACDEFVKVTTGKVSWEYNMATGTSAKL
ncbi:MAG: hypothetical protein H7331_10460 [Bacteroidia bacterium]|nr:hypothetical protein [Bacteroidia bacterium]